MQSTSSSLSSEPILPVSSGSFGPTSAATPRSGRVSESEAPSGAPVGAIGETPPAAILERARSASPAILGGIEIVAILPGGNTNRVWLVEGPRGKAVLKIYRENRGSPLFPNDASAERVALEALSPRGLAPQPLAAGRDEGLDWLVYAHREGAPWESGVAPVAALLARVHETDPPAGLRRAPGGSAAAASQGQAILDGCPDSADRQRIADARPPDSVFVPPVPPGKLECLIHGDPVPGNLLCGPDGPGLIDWQCPGIGDPVEDLAIFLSPAMQQVYRGAPLDDSEREAFLAAYPFRERVARYRASRPWHHWRMACHCLGRVAGAGTLERSLAVGEAGATQASVAYSRGLELELAALRESMAPGARGR